MDGSEILAEQTDVVGVSQQLLGHYLGLCAEAQPRQGLGVPEAAHRERAVGETDAVVMLVAMQEVATRGKLPGDVANVGLGVRLAAPQIAQVDHHQQRRVRVVGVDAVAVEAELRPPAALLDQAAGARRQATSLRLQIGLIQPLADARRDHRADPVHEQRERVHALVTADLPDAGVGLLERALEPIEQTLDEPLGAAGQVLAEADIEEDRRDRGDHLAVDVVLLLAPGVVARAHGLLAAVAGEVLEHRLVQLALAADGVHGLEMLRRCFRQVLEEGDERFHLVEVTDAAHRA